MRANYSIVQVRKNSDQFLKIYCEKYVFETKANPDNARDARLFKLKGGFSKGQSNHSYLSTKALRT